MPNRILQGISEETRLLFKLSPSSKLWHTPFLAAACVGIPLLTAYYLNQVGAGMLMCTGAFVILYLPPGNLRAKMLTLLLCSLGFSVSFALGLAFAYSRTVSIVALIIFAFVVHFLVGFLKMRPPGSFLFIMVFTIAICMPYESHTIPVKSLLLLAGSFLTCILTFFYYLVFLDFMSVLEMVPVESKSLNAVLVDSAFLALFVGASLFAAEQFNLQKPYWIPISCASVMQGLTIRHMWQRSFQRILGTLLGILIAWLILLAHPTVIAICLVIIALQFLADTFIGRHYALVVVFFTPIAIFLAEAGSGMHANADVLMEARVTDTFIGSLFGLAGGYCLHRPLWKRLLKFQFKNESAD